MSLYITSRRPVGGPVTVDEGTTRPRSPMGLLAMFTARAVVVAVVLTACGRGAAPLDAGEVDSGTPAVDAGDGDAGLQDAGTGSPDGGVTDGGIPDGGGADAGCGGRLVDADAVKRESVARLQAFFGVDAGLANGTLYFRDVAAGLPGCPVYDLAALVYVAPIAPPLLPPEAATQLAAAGQDPVVEYVWGLNGYRQILFNVRQGTFGTLPMGQIHPLSFIATLGAGVTPARAMQIRDELQALSGPAPVDLLEQIGLVTCGPRVDDENSLDVDGLTEGPYRSGVLAAVDRARSTADVDSIEWSFMAYKFDLDEEPIRPLDGGAVCADALRKVRPRHEPDGGSIFASLSSLPSPFGPGWVANPAVAHCGP